ncbi:MAG: TRAP transporter small permease, partial [Pseudomonadota bacterium]
EWVIPLAFTAVAAFVIWTMPRYIIAFGGGSDALKARYPGASATDLGILALLPILLLIGVFTVRTAALERPGLWGLDRLSLFVGRVVMVLIALLVSVMFYEVVLRYVFEAPTLWANELSLWLAGFVFLFSGLYAMRERAHIRIYILYDLFPRWLQKTCDVISTGLICAFAVAILWGGWNEAYAKFFRWETFGTAFDPPIPATMKPILILGVFLVALQAVSNLIADWNRREEHSPIEDAEEIALLKQQYRKPD